MACLEFFAKWRAIASLDPPYAFPKFNNCLALESLYDPLIHAGVPVAGNGQP